VLHLFLGTAEKVPLLLVRTAEAAHQAAEQATPHSIKVVMASWGLVAVVTTQAAHRYLRHPVCRVDFQLISLARVVVALQAKTA
jgi:hypothetical protein